MKTPEEKLAAKAAREQESAAFRAEKRTKPPRFLKENPRCKR